MTLPEADYTPFAHIKTYAEQRYERLVETVDEYLNDNEVGAQQFLDDLQKACLELKQHHDRIIDNFTTVQDFFR